MGYYGVKLYNTKQTNVLFQTCTHSARAKIIQNMPSKADFYKLLLVFIVIARKQEQGKVQAPSPLHYDCLPELAKANFIRFRFFFCQKEWVYANSFLFSVAPCPTLWSAECLNKSTCKEMCGLQQAQDGVMPGIPDLVSVVKSPVSRFKKLNPLPGYSWCWWNSL